MSRASAVVLAGGTSRRLGRDKALARVGGRPLLVRVLDAAAPSAREILVVTADRDAHARVLREHGWSPDGRPGEGPVDADAGPGGGRLRLLADRRPGRGPLAGVETGLAAASSEACLLLACDLPFLPAEVPARLLRELVRWRGAAGGAEASADRPRAVLPVVEGRRQPMCAAVERRAGSAAVACLDDDRPSVAAWLERLEVREIPLERLAAAHEEGRAARRWLLDVDTPEALEEARRLASSSGAD